MAKATKATKAKAAGTKTEDWKINQLEIKNFKSIKDLKISPARVNIFIGKPNAGKSNLIEALTFLALDFPPNIILPGKIIRYSTTASLYYDYNNKADIIWAINERIYLLRNHQGTYHYDEMLHKSKNDGLRNIALIGQDGKVLSSSHSQHNNISIYHFEDIPFHENKYSDYRLRFDAGNIWQLIRHSSDLKKFATSFVKQFGLNILFQKDSNKFDLMKIEGDSYTLIDFVLTPDTFQRMLYYLAAIDSNENMVLLFEEPEAQSFPPYIQELAERIIDDKNNQYFITTHSPFVVEKMLERAGTENDVKIFVTYYEDYQTKVHELSREEIDQILDYNIDLFFNMEAFQKA